MIRRAFPFAALPLLLLAACSGRAAGEGQKPAVAVSVATAAARDMERSLEVVGVLDPKAIAEVKAEYPGTVTEVLVTEWVPVRRGQVLARLDAREAHAARLQAQAGAERAEREYARAIKLKGAGLLTAQELEGAQTEREAARAGLDALRARADKSVIRAPIDGVVAMRDANVGDLATDKPLFRIVDNRLFDLTMAVPSSRIAEVAVGQRVTFTTDAVPGRSFEGQIAFVNPSADAVSRTVKVVAEVPNADGALKSDLFVRGRVLLGRREAVVQVPRAALVSWDVEARRGVLFAVEGDRALRREVATGAVQGDAVEVIAGIAAGDSVVVRGGFNLQDGDRVEMSKEEGEKGRK